MAGEVAQNAAEEVAGWSLTGWLGGLWGGATTLFQASETGAKGVSAVCEDLSKKEERSCEHRRHERMTTLRPVQNWLGMRSKIPLGIERARSRWE